MVAIWLCLRHRRIWKLGRGGHGSSRRNYWSGASPSHRDPASSLRRRLLTVGQHGRIHELGAFRPCSDEDVFAVQWRHFTSHGFMGAPHFEQGKVVKDCSGSMACGTSFARQCLQTWASARTSSLQSGQRTCVRGVGMSSDSSRSRSRSDFTTSAAMIPMSGLRKSASRKKVIPLRPLDDAIQPAKTEKANQPTIHSILEHLSQPIAERGFGLRVTRHKGL